MWPKLLANLSSADALSVSFSETQVEPLLSNFCNIHKVPYPHDLLQMLSNPFLPLQIELLRESGQRSRLQLFNLQFHLDKSFYFTYSQARQPLFAW